MKLKNIFTSLLFAASIASSSCSDFLDVTPKDSLTGELPDVIFNKATSESALRGVYNGLADAGYYGTSFQSIAYLSGDNIVWTGSQSQVQEFINHRVNADNATISSAWNAIYRTISRANIIIHHVPSVVDPVFTDAQKNQIIGEAYFIRALAYFDLARTWGGVPLITQPTFTPTDNSEIGRSTIEETYALVLSDLEAAEPLLPETTDRYRATRKTVWALKSRYYLYQENWTKAEEYATRIISDASYRLVKPFSAFTTNDAKGTNESIFEISYNGTTEQNTHRNQWQPQTNGGTRQWAPNEAFLKLVNDPAIGGNRSVLVAKDNQNRWYGNLYYSKTLADPSYLFRIAELYLIRAEARAKQDKAIDAKADLDAVRARADLAPSPAVTSAELLLAIENERRIEFAFEAHRWFDLVRTKRAVVVLGIKPEETFRYRLPLPADQILVDKTLANDQNPGY